MTTAATARATLLLLLLAICGCAPRPPAREGRAAAAPHGVADLVILGARAWTGVEDAAPAEGVAVVGDRIVDAGTRAELERWVGPETRRIDVPGGLVLPGFIDAHVHFLTGGLGLASVQLRDAATPEEFIRRIAAFTRTVPAGTWITNGDWDHERWGGELPRRSWIDSVTPDHPVWINRLDGHMALANTAALRVALVTDPPPEVEGGAIERDAEGRLTGLFRDNAMSLVGRAVPEPDAATLDRALDAAMAYVAERGVTSVHDMAGWGDLAVYPRAHAAGRLDTRVYLAVPLAQWPALRDTVSARGRGDDLLRIGGLKGFVDGSLGSHTAAFEAPFTDAPGDRGLLVNTPGDLHRWIAGADAAGLHVMVHAIGDRANRILLDTYERVARENGPRDRRFRIEHAQHLRPADIPRFAALGVIPSMQPYHAIDDGRWADRVIGPERARTTYAFRSLPDAGARLAFGSDWFVAPATPLEGIYAAVTRRTLDGGRLGPGAEDHGRGSAPRLHRERRVRRLRRGPPRDAGARQARRPRRRRPGSVRDRPGLHPRRARGDDGGGRSRRLRAVTPIRPPPGERTRCVAVVLAAGRGTRMRAAADVALTPAQAAAADSGHKFLVPFHGRPFLDYVLDEVEAAGFEEVCVVVAPDSPLLDDDGAALATRRVRLAVQPEPRGSADAVLAAEPVVAGGDLVVLNADNLYPASVLRRMRELDGPGLAAFDRDALVRASNIPPERVAAFALVREDDGLLAEIVEKPSPRTAAAMATAPVSMTCWRFGPSIFDACRDVAPSARGELELTDAVALAMRRGARFRVVPVSAGVLDVSRREDIPAVERLLAERAPR